MAEPDVLPPAGPSKSPTLKAPDHLNSAGLRIEYAEGKGRGVYASCEIPAQTLIEISPVLLLTAQEYAEHGRHTVLDHYTFVWRDGRMALALGLGSLFNHAQRPNVSYTIDYATESIQYTTSRRILPDEELCIFYGHKLWFDPVDATDAGRREPSEEPDDGWGGLIAVEDDGEEESGEISTSSIHALLDRSNGGNPEQVVPEEKLPFRRLKLTPEEEEEEDMDAIRKEEAWVVDLPDPRLAAVMLKWMKQSGLDTPSMAHLKRIRKHDGKMSMVLILTREQRNAPTFPENIELPPPYVVPVPKTAALTMPSLMLKSSLWPTIYAPRKKFEPERWTRDRVRWACEAMKQVVRKAQGASRAGELPIAAYVPMPFDEETRVATRMLEPISAHDTRKSASHPLRHSIINLVRAVGELRASSSARTTISSVPVSHPPQLTSVVDVPPPSLDQVSAALSQSQLHAHPLPLRTPESEPGASQGETRAANGAHYLLTSLTLFTTHEPCIMCSMALLHSRVKEVFYLIPMTKTGGCGGLTCVPRLPGVNHRYGVSVWKFAGEKSLDKVVGESGLALDEACDA
ncbi:hypothetical protein C8Q80DRAFT_1266723 [Daedaleopsis nitida]|nr:hypothetical protein C8Q80DRAFT_1266723 [Daedaleopsis nitida]